jgi:uncharacterized SAM-binding protein YcdF (DUF218 family)
VFFALSKLLDVFLSPYTWALVLLAAAIPWRAARARARKWKKQRALGAAGLGVLLLASWAPIANAIAWRLEHSTVSTFRNDVTYDAVVLLGGLVEEDASATSGQPSYNDNVERMLVTYRLLKDGKARVAIVSGATMNPKLAAYGEAVLVGRQLEEWGIAKERIIVEDRALNTRDNAVYSERIVRERGYQSVLIVTSAFHMLRAAECFAAVGLKVDTLSVDYRARERVAGLPELIPRAQSLALTSAMLREIFGRFVYRVQGYGKSVP